MGEISDGKKDDISKYNEANLNIERLHNCWLRCAAYRLQSTFFSWEKELDTIWSELYQDIMRKSNKEAIIKEQEECKSAIRKVNSIRTPSKNPFDTTTSKEEGLKKVKSYKVLSEYHLWLRKTQDEMGKGGIYKDPDEDDFE